MTGNDIIAPWDGSTAGEVAFPYAKLVQQIFGGTIRFVRVVEDGKTSVADVASQQATFEERARAVLQKNSLTADDCSFQVIVGEPAAKVLALSASAGFVVLAGHGRGGFRATVVGSVADKIVRGAEVPVLLVPAVDQVPATPKRVVVTLDGSARAERALNPARHIAQALGAQLLLVRAYNFQPVGPIDQPISGLLAAAHQEAADYLHVTVQPGEDSLAVQGEPSEAILEAASDIDAGLVVMTKTGKGLAKRLALGSATDRVMHALHRPLLIVPPDSAEA